MFRDPDQLRAEMRRRREASPAAADKRVPGLPATEAEVDSNVAQPLGRLRMGLAVAGVAVALGAGFAYEQHQRRNAPPSDPVPNRVAHGDPFREAFENSFDAYREKRYSRAIEEYFKVEELCTISSGDYRSELPVSEMRRLHWLLATSLVPLVNEFYEDPEGMLVRHPDLRADSVASLKVSLETCFLDRGYSRAFVVPKSADVTRLSSIELEQRAETVAYTRRKQISFEGVEFYLPIRPPAPQESLLVPVKQ